MKKMISCMLVMVLLLSMAVVPGYAYAGGMTPPGLAKKGVVPPGIAKKFVDIEGLEWARSAIEKMLLKGIIQGINEQQFAPSQNVSKVEALAMIIRTMGWEQEAKISNELIRKGQKEDVMENRLQDWAKGYIDMAKQMGLIDEVDLMQHNFSSHATRQEIAKYVIRALGYEKEAQKHMKEKLRFKDASAVQVGSIGYVYLIDQKGIMQGYPDKTFRPNQPVKRVEMTTIVANLDEKVDSDVDKVEVVGEIKSIKDTSIDVIIKSETKRYTIDTNVVVYDENNKRISYSRLEVGDKVQLFFNEGKVIYIQVKEEKDDKIIAEYEGIVKDVDRHSITLEIKKMTVFFEVEEDAVIKINGVRSELEDIEEKDVVRVKVDERNRVREMDVTREKEEEVVVEGKLLLIHEETLILERTGKIETYDMDEDVEIYINDVIRDIEDLEIGKKVEIVLKDEKVIEVRWNSTVVLVQ